MRLLDRYLLRELLLPLSYCLVGFLLCFILFDAMDEAGNFQRYRLNFLDVAEYYAEKTPGFLVSSYVMPMALLLALLYALTNHARHNELTAMRAAGIPLWRISAPYFGVGLLFSAAYFALNEQVVPNAADDAERILLRNVTKQSKAAEKFWERNVLFVNAPDGRTWQIGAYHRRARQMVNPNIVWQKRDGTRHEIFAERGRWMENRWVFTNVQYFVYAPNRAIPEKFRTNTMVLSGWRETPRLIRSEITISELDDVRDMRRTQLSAAAILDYLRLHPALDQRRSDVLRTMLHSRLAAPWMCVVIVLIAVPFGALPGRRNAFVGVASSIFICFAYLVLKDLTLALGSGGYVAPWIAAWAPNAVFAGAGAFLIWRIR